MTQTRERSATVKHGVVPACKSSPGVMGRSTTVPAIGRTNQARDARGRLSLLNGFDGLRIHFERNELLQGGFGIGFSIGGINFGLLGFAQADAVMLDQLLVHVRQAGG